jgi:hypothetical protein
MPATDEALAWQRAPAMKRASEMRMTGLRPSASASRPEAGLARRAKTEVMLVTSDLSSVVRGRWERSLWMETRVDEMTPVLGRVRTCTIV